MKYLKKYRIFESLEDIHLICKKYDIQNYTINHDGSIDVDGDVYLSTRGLVKLPLKFRNVSGYFSCGGNKLTTLEGVPQSVGGDFYCNSNQLTTLEGAPQSVGGYFHCSYNKLTTLEGAPQSVGGYFSCYNNQLTTLEGAPQSVGGYFSCYNNQLTSLEGAPQSVGDFHCNDNPVFVIWDLFKDYSLVEFFNDCDIIHDGDRTPSVVIDRLNYFLQEIGKDEVKSVKGYNNI